MDEDHNIAEHSLSARERALQEKIVRLERKLEGYESEIDIIDNQRQKLEERVISMESVLETTEKEVLDKEIAKNHLAEKLNSMTQQSEQYKSLFTAERNKNKYSIERLETIMSTVEAEMVTRKEFQGFLNEMLSAVKEGFHAQLKVVFDRLTETENNIREMSRKKNQTTSQTKPQVLPNPPGTTNNKNLSSKEVTSPTSPTSPIRVRHDSSTSYTEDIHFEPLIPLPEQIEVQTGEEDEEVMFSCRAKLYRYDKDVSAWKERGIGTLKILYNSDKGRSRILMRREVVHKICANHFITADMMLTEKKGTANAWIWNTFADYSEEVSKPEQLAVKFKTQDEFLLFKEKFEQCQKTSKKDASKVQGTATGTSEKSSNLMAKFAPKPGSWSCSVCLVPNEERTTVCVACGAAKLSDGATSSLTEAPKSGFQSTTSGASNTGFSVLQGNPPSGSPFKFGKSGAETLNTSSGNSPFTFGTSDAGTLNTNLSNSSFTFGKSDSPFTFGKIDEATLNTSLTSSPFTFGAPPSDEDAVSDAESSEMPSTSKPPTTQPFVLAAFGIPAIASQSNPSTFAFGSSGMTGSSPFSFSMAEKPVSENIASAGETSAFGGGTPEQAGPAVSFGSFKSESSPCFDLDVSNHSTASTQTDPLVCEKCEGDNQVTPNISQELQLTENQPQSSFSFGTPTSNQEIPEQKLFWQQATDGTTSWAEGVKAWHQATPPFMDSAKAQSQTAPLTSQLSSQPLTLPPQGEFTSNSSPEVNFYGSELLRRLVATKQQQDSNNQESQAGGYDFTPYVVDEPGEETTLQGAAKPISTVIVEECDNDDDEAIIDEYEESTDDSLSYTTTEGEDGEEEIEASLVPSSSKPQTQSSFSSSQGKVLTAPVKPVPIHSTQVENVGPANLPAYITGRRFLTAKSPLKGSKKQDEDCVLVYEVRASMADRDKASRLLLPSNFFNYRKYEACPGCFGCRGIVRKKETANLSNTEGKDKKDKPISITPEESGSASHVFGQSSIVGQLTFSSVKPKEGDAFPPAQKDSYKPFQGAGMQLFAEPSEDVEGQDNDKFHFEPVIPLPDEIQVVTGEEGLEVLFSERSKLYRFDADSGQWKERGVGDIKLLRHPISSQGRVLMRREQIKKLCANHNINAGMELKPNIGSDRSWVWYTPADYSEGEARPEKLAIKLKSAEIAGKFKEVFNDLKETLSSEICPETEPTENEQGAGCALYNKFISTFAAAPDTWTCELCYVQNNAEDSKCIACDSVKTIVGSLEPEEEKSEFTTTTINPSAIESIEPSTFQDLHEESTPAASIFQSPSVEGWTSSQLFTIGRGESSEDKADDEIYLSPSKTSSPSKPGITLPQKPSTPLSHDSALMDLPFGTNTPAKFTFRLMASPGSPSPRKPKSPLSPSSPLSPESPGYAEDDGPHFEPLIPLPEKVECRTGEEGQEVLFCDRCKLYRYDSDTSQWKDRGVGDIKILHHPSSERYRVLMRREHVFKLCANHIVSADMVLKPFPNSDRAWLWTTLADFSEEVSSAETLAARFRTNEIAGQFKDTFDKAVQSRACKADIVESGAKPEGKHPDQGTRKKQEDDIAVVFDKGVTDDQKERAKQLELPSHFFGYEGSSSEASSDHSETCASKQDQPTSNDGPEEISTPSKSSFLFGSASVASLTFQSVAVSSLGDSPFDEEKQGKSPGFTGVGSQLFATRNTDDDDGTTEVDHDGPRFEPVIPLPDKIDVKTGEEDEEVMFSHRAKLYRFLAEDKQWKERGIGDIKLMRNKQTGKMRVLMRRAQVLKLCANHQITSDMKLQPNAGSEKSWVWSTLADFSEQECKAERLAVRFKSEVIAKQFKEKFEECQEMLKNQTSVKPNQDKQGHKEVKEDLLTKFKATEGSWECDICMVRNDSDKVECAACGSLKPGAEPSQDQKKDVKSLFSFGSGASSSGTGFSFGSSASSSGAGFSFGSFGSTGTSEPDIKPFFSFGSLSQTPNSSSVVPFGFGSLQQGGNINEQQTAGDSEESVSPLNDQPPGEDVDDNEGDHSQNVQDAQGSTDDADDSNIKETTSTEESVKTSPLDKQVEKDPKPDAEQTFLFGSSSISSLSFQSVADSSLTSSPFTQTTSKTSPGFAGAGWTLFASQASTDHNESAEDDHEGPHFEPVIPLPDKIDVKTGEEDEEVMFSHRAKLYRFVAEDKQWKERGIGDIKLLRNNQTGKMRVLMRRAQVLKLCANHQITSDMKLQPNAGSEKSWAWSTLADFSEQECKAERLAVRFKSEAIAKQFKEKFEECQEMLKNQTSVKPNQDKQGHKEVKEDLLTKFKATEGSWECDICMVRNDSDKVECAACGSLKPGAEPSQDQKKDVKPSFSFGSGASSGAGFSFGSTGTSEPDTKPFFSFGSLNQTPNSSSGVPLSFGTLQQGGNISVQTEESNKVASESDEQTPGEDADDNEGDATQNVEEGDVTDEAQAEDSSEEEIATVDPIRVDREEKPLPDSLPLSHGEEPFQDHERLTGVVETSDEQGSSKADETTDESHSEEKASLSSEEQPVQDIPGDSGTEEVALKPANNSEAKVKEDLKQDEAKQPEGIQEAEEEGTS